MTFSTSVRSKSCLHSINTANTHRACSDNASVRTSAPILRKKKKKRCIPNEWTNKNVVTLKKTVAALKTMQKNKPWTRCGLVWRTPKLCNTISQSCEDGCSSVRQTEGRSGIKESGGAIEPLNELHWASGCVTLDTLIKMLSNSPKSWKHIRDCNKHVAETIKEGRAAYGKHSQKLPQQRWNASGATVFSDWKLAAAPV